MVTKPGTNDADGDGKKGGSVKADSPEGRLITLEKQMAAVCELLTSNGMSLPKALAPKPAKEPEAEAE